MKENNPTNTKVKTYNQFVCGFIFEFPLFSGSIGDPEYQPSNLRIQSIADSIFNRYPFPLSEIQILVDSVTKELGEKNPNIERGVVKIIEFAIGNGLSLYQAAKIHNS